MSDRKTSPKMVQANGNTLAYMSGKSRDSCSLELS